MSFYRQQTLKTVKALLEGCGKISTMLDFGAGDGWYSYQLKQVNIATKMIALDTVKRKQSFLETTLYDGEKLPFPDRSMDLILSIDAIHHTPYPIKIIYELLRCTGKYLLIKDRVYWTGLGKASLSLLDEIGNRRFGIPSTYRYQHAWEWFPAIAQAGFQLSEFIYPLKCNRSLLGWWSNRFQWAALWKRI
ncbi:MAG: class I SAM-dependent methyltransferase [Candidatus Omnitrophica bacterium]|nr:class I SAM-dependent methyltransferase [Candidatus Omnitrophota bacterium]